ncbi:MAG: hypothetical protein ISR65_02140 [Bacteriovoracaceae bacterium]|nr:hypothetical protein [Bacteriovoracaceae bacterium]
MKQNMCKNCSVKGYSFELCTAHRIHMGGKGKCSNFQRKKSYKDHLKLNTVVYAGASVLGVTAGIVAAPVLGLPVIAHAAFFKVGAGLLGGSMSIMENKKKDTEKVIEGEGDEHGNESEE